MGFESDESVVQELVLFADNTGSLYRQKQAYRLMLLKHACRGNFDEAKAVKGMTPFANLAAKQYAREHSTWGQPFGGFTPTDRRGAAREWVNELVSQVKDRGRFPGDLLDAERALLTSPRCKLPKGW